MPAYTSAANHKVISLVQGFPTYLFGGWPLTTPATRFLISQVQITSDVATITGTIVEGNIPTVGQLITVQQVQSDGGVFNVTAVAITAVSINLATGQGTISFALTQANYGPDATPNAAGLALVFQSETSETLAAQASVPCTLPIQDPKTDSARTVTAAVSFPSAPTAVTVNLQMALMDIDSEYVNVSSTPIVSATNVGNVAQYSLNTARFYRFKNTSLTGTGTIIAKLMF